MLLCTLIITDHKVHDNTVIALDNLQHVHTAIFKLRELYAAGHYKGKTRGSGGLSQHE